VPGCLIRAWRSASDHEAKTVSDSAGAFTLLLPDTGTWYLEVASLGYRPARREIYASPGTEQVEVRLRFQPLLMDEMVVRARPHGGAERTPAFVEVIPIKDQIVGAALPELLDEAVGVTIQRYGGLGSFSTVSIRGSTAEQVQVYLDGVPLNQAAGGGVDLGDLPIGGVESIEIYRGSVPARFGGNSIGGVIHIRTQDAGGQDQARLQARSGSFSTHQLSLSAGRRTGRWDMLGLVDLSVSDNDFRFWDDNGTEYNAADDEWAHRANSDFHSLRAMAKADAPWGASRILLHSTVDLSHRGIPGIGNYQSLHTRYDTWRSVTELELFGPLSPAGHSGYRLKGYQVVQVGRYKDLRGEVGAGSRHDRNTTRSLGGRGELNALLLRGGLLTVFVGVRRETFDPDNLLRKASQLLDSRRHSVSSGAEIEIPLVRELVRLTGGAQLEVIDDTFYDEKIIAVDELLPSRDNVERLRGFRFGGQVQLTDGWALKGHSGRYQRAPSFYELFGDRGAVTGNTDLTSEEGRNWDVGLVYRGPDRPSGPLTAEVVYYRNVVDDLIRFIQNSQRVSRPHNIGKGRTHGVESRVQTRWSGTVQAGGSYVYQHAENRSPYVYERGNDLPNSPRHTLNGRLSLSRKQVSLRYELSRESRHFLDRANLRAVPSRTIHNLGGSVGVADGTELSCEIRNLTANQVADLWGYPLPGRAFFITLKQDMLALTE